MVYLKTYENFIKKIRDKLVSKDKILDAGFNQNEKMQLERIGFTITVNYGKSLAKYKIISKDFTITIQSFFIEDAYVPGVAEKIYKLNTTNLITKEFKEFKTLLKFLEEIIPEDEVEAKKYNL